MLNHGLGVVGSEETKPYSTEQGEPKVGLDMVIQGPVTANVIQAEGTVTHIQLDCV